MLPLCLRCFNNSHALGRRLDIPTRLQDEHDQGDAISPLLFYTLHLPGSLPFASPLKLSNYFLPQGLHTCLFFCLLYASLNSAWLVST